MAQPDVLPGPRIRQMVALMLRLALGISILNAGMARHLGARMTNQVPGLTMLNGTSEFLSALAYTQVAIGLALIVGFLLTPAAVGACLLILLAPVFQIAMEVGYGNSGQSFLNDPFFVASSITMPILMLPAALVLWFSPVANHPYSVDALISARTREMTAIRPPGMTAAPAEAGSPGRDPA